jgi:hypothetical protein
VGGLFIGGLALDLAHAAEREVPPRTASVPASVPSGDAATDVVTSFYRALLQEEPPPREQESALFDPKSAMRWRLVLGKGDEADTKDIEPMRRTAEQRARMLREKVLG